MNREQDKKLLPIIEAFANGEEIQFKDSAGNWENSNNPMFYDLREYRIKPKPRECWVNICRFNTFSTCHETKDSAEKVLNDANLDLRTWETVKFREVTDEPDM